MRKIIPLTLCILIVAIIVGLKLRRPPPPPPPPPVDPDLIARVGSCEIRVPDFERELERRGGRNPASVDRDVLLEEMIQRQALIARAHKLGLHEGADYIRKCENMLIGELRQRELEPNLHTMDVTDDEARQYYDTHIEAHTTPAKRKLAMITIVVHDKMSEDKRKRCGDRIREARNKALSQTSTKGVRGFGKIAIEYSEDQTTRYKGGEIGWVTEGREYRWPKPVVAAGFALEAIGDISDVIETETALYIVRHCDVREAEVAPFEKALPQLRHQLLLDKRREAEKAFEETARTSVTVEIFPEALDRVPVPEPTGGETTPPALP